MNEQAATYDGLDPGLIKDYIPGLEHHYSWGANCVIEGCGSLATITRPDEQLIDHSRALKLLSQNGWLRLAPGRYLCSSHHSMSYEEAAAGTTTDDKEHPEYVCPWCGLIDNTVEAILIHKLDCPSRPERLS